VDGGSVACDRGSIRNAGANTATLKVCGAPRPGVWHMPKPKVVVTVDVKVDVAAICRAIALLVLLIS
jgi:hypothetical protein